MATRIFFLLLMMALVLVPVGCDEEITGDREDDPSTTEEPPPDPNTTYTIGGAINGYSSAGLELRLNTGSPKAVASGATVYRFDEPVSRNTLYVVTVSRQPDGATCTVGANTGIVTDRAVNNANVECLPQAYNLTGAVAGLVHGPLDIELLSGTARKTVTVQPGDTIFTFPAGVLHGLEYQVRLKGDPPGQVCASNGGLLSGTASGPIGDVAFACAEKQYLVAATLTGHTSTLQLRLSYGSKTELVPANASNDSVVFAGPFSYKTSWQLAVPSLPTGQTCSAVPSSGTLIADVKATVTCATLIHSVSGQISGQSAPFSIALGDEVINVAASQTAFAFSTLFASGSQYQVRIETQPLNAFCSVQNGLGTLFGNVSNVSVTCEPTKAVAVFAGGNSSCAVLNNGYAKCWGANQYGQLGYGHTQDVGLLPGEMENLTSVPLEGSFVPLQIALADDHLCFLSADHRLRCAGDNQARQLGYADGQPRGESPATVLSQVEDVALPNDELQIVGVAVANGMTCARTDSDEFYCFGSNQWSRLGIVGDDPYYSPTLPAIRSQLRPLNDLRPSATHSCAITASQELLCWGKVASGQTAHPAVLLNSYCNVYQNQTGNVQGSGTFSDNNCIALFGAVWSFVTSAFTHSACSGYASRTDTVAQGTSCSQYPGSGWEYVSSAFSHTTCHGYENQSFYAEATTIPEAQSCPSGWERTGSIFHGVNNETGTWIYTNFCRRCTSSTNYYNQTCRLCTAYNHFYSVTCRRCTETIFEYDWEVGNDPGELDNAPVFGMGEDLVPLQLSQGYDYTCVRSTTGEVKCWGLNDEGQLGYGDTANRGDHAGETPEHLPEVDFGGTAKTLVTGSSHSCVITNAGGVRCWGDNDHGQLGYGDQARRGDTPISMGANLLDVNLGAGRTAVQIAAGDNHTCALLDNGKVKCWGRNHRGQLGYGDNLTRGPLPSHMGNNLPNVQL